MDGIHHISIVVSDLEAAAEIYGRLLAPCHIVRESLPARGVETARIRIGDSWIVLVAPVGCDGVVVERLERHGEGVFVVSLAGRPLSAMQANPDRSDAEAVDSRARTGLAHWIVRDVARLHEGRLTLQFCEDPES